jgi:luciferase family oxidoreductase group 1
VKLSVIDQSPVSAGFTPADALHNTIELARLTDRLGYHRYWIAEHHAIPALASPAPEILIDRVAAETSTIRVGSGAVLLPHYSPLKVAETFRVLHALYPNRIDLGIGRAPGGTPLDSYALRRYRDHEPGDDFPRQLVELLTFLHGGFPADHPFSRIIVTPEPLERFGGGATGTAVRLCPFHRSTAHPSGDRALPLALHLVEWIQATNHPRTRRDLCRYR